ncbi:hypothetical protein J7443_05145 [Tropicibacter sp. R15_0]|nr:hypothetical protein [Tropicibacter sp. R15_0]
MLGLLRLLARHGRFVLIAGLVAGVLLPQVASFLRPWLSELVLALLCLNALRIGFPDALRGLRIFKSTLTLVLAYQLGLPLLLLLAAWAAGLHHSPVVITGLLVLAAPPVTAAPNMSVMLGHAPEPAFRLLTLGTLLMPLTILPIFWVSPALGNWQAALDAAVTLGLSLTAAVAIGFAGRAVFKPKMCAEETQVLDGVISVTLAVIVIGLMSAIAPMLSKAPGQVVAWLLFAFALNFGAQIAAFLVMKRCGSQKERVPFAIVAGNRNVALFLVASSFTQTPEFLIFLGCYQFPMYLTPILMRPIYSSQNVG